MTVERLEIRRDALVVAHLQRAKKGLWVTYTPEVLDTVATGTPVLSCSLPVRSTRLEASAWARGLLPEGQHLNDLAAAADVAASDTFGMLARYGRDIAGAFEIVTEGADPRIPRYDLYLTDELHAEVAGLATTPLAVHDDSELSLPGLQDKMVAVRVGSDWGRPVHGYPSTHIFKVDPLDKPGIVDAEAACLRLARAVDLTDIDVERARFRWPRNHHRFAVRSDRTRRRHSGTPPPGGPPPGARRAPRQCETAGQVPGGRHVRAAQLVARSRPPRQLRPRRGHSAPSTRPHTQSRTRP